MRSGQLLTISMVSVLFAPRQLVYSLSPSKPSRPVGTYGWGTPLMILQSVAISGSQRQSAAISHGLHSLPV